MKFKHRLALVLAVSIGALGVSCVGSSAPQSMANPDVFANPEQVRYEGSGGLVLPDTVDSSTRNEVIGCRGCAWKLTVACVPGPENYCDAGIRACPGLIDHMRVWFKPVYGDWQEVDRICLTNYEVTTVADLERAMSESFARYVPEQAVLCWPNHGAITNLPLICESGQSSKVVMWQIPIAGFDVAISTTPSWTWDFDGSPFFSRKAGGSYPNLDISHTFPTPGRKVISLTTRWNGAFRIDSLDSVPIEGELIQGSSIHVTIGQAKARLRCPGEGSC